MEAARDKLLLILALLVATTSPIQHVLHRQHPARKMLQRGNLAARLMLFARFVGRLFASRMTVESSLPTGVNAC